MQAKFLLKRYVFGGTIFSCRATTSGNPFGVAGVAPLRFRMMVVAFRVARRVPEE